MGEKIKYKDIRKNEEINMLIDKGNCVLKTMGFTDHSTKHAAKVAARAGWILKSLGYNWVASPAICTISATASTEMTMLTAERCWHIRYLRK